MAHEDARGGRGDVFLGGVESVPLGRKKAGIITDYWRETAEDDSESCQEQPARVVVTKKVVTPRCRDGGGEALARMGPVEIARNAGSRYRSERLPSAFLPDENIPKKRRRVLNTPEAGSGLAGRGERTALG